MKNFTLDLAQTLGLINGDDCMFLLQLIDISQEAAAHIIYDIQNCKGLDDVICRYSGNHSTGMAEFIIKKPLTVCIDEPIPQSMIESVKQAYHAKSVQQFEEGSHVEKRVKTIYPSEDRQHLITQFCAALDLSLNKRLTAAEKNESFRSLVYDNMFKFDVFTCISTRLLMRDKLRSESRDTINGVNCGVCPFGSRDVGKCNIRCLRGDTSKTLNNIISCLSFGDLNESMFMSKPDNSGTGLLAVSSGSFSNLSAMLDLEQFLDVNGLF